MRIEVDEYGYIYVIMPNGEKRDILVDVPDSICYGKLKLGDTIIEAEGVDG